MLTRYLSIITLLFTLWVSAAFAEGNQQVSMPSALDIVKHCNIKNPGEDQTSILTIILRDKDGSEKKNVYHRYWKAYYGADGVDDKMVLFTEFPPDARGAGFMRWGYLDTDKSAEQWLYLPVLKKIRRVSIRDPGDSFLGSDLTYGDIGARGVDADEHKVLQTQKKGNLEYFLIESVPRQKNWLYSKTISMYVMPGDWENCVKLRMDYYDRKGELLKQQSLKWQKVDSAWVWDEVLINNVQTSHSSLFQVRNVKINVGLSDDMFTERRLSMGP